MVTLKDKVVVITGASSGMGKATAIAFARKGSKVVLAARRLEKLNQIKKHIKSFNRNVLCVKTDVTSEKDVRRLFDAAEKRFKRIDILVNNAGRGLKSCIHDITTAEWESVIGTNLTGVFLCTREAVQRMRRKKIPGHIITVSSIAGLYGAPNYAAYCASKHAVTGFKRSAKLELRKHNIKVSTIHPARVDTEFFDSYKKRPHRSQMISPKDIAKVILARASRNIFRIIWYRVALIFKRIYYAVRHAVK